MIRGAEEVAVQRDPELAGAGSQRREVVHVGQQRHAAELDRRIRAGVAPEDQERRLQGPGADCDIRVEAVAAGRERERTIDGSLRWASGQGSMTGPWWNHG